ncbi:MAG: PKD domain-containing protein [Bacteroidota bacterium]
MKNILLALLVVCICPSLASLTNEGNLLAQTAFTLEAECAQVGSAWATVSDAGASNGEYTVRMSGDAKSAPPPDLPENHVSFTLTNVLAANYHLFALVRGTGPNNDSFWVRVNGGAWVAWSSGLPSNGAFEWRVSPNSAFALTGGTNTIDFAYREAGTHLDKIHLNTTGNTPTGQGAAATNCGSSNQAPTAVAAASPTSGNAPLTVNLDGSGSSDPDGNIMGYAWSWSGGSSTLASTSATFNTPGTYAITLTVTDNDGATDTDVVNVTVSAGSGGTDIWLEAECGIVGTNWDPRTGATYSNGEYLVPLLNYSNALPPDVPENRVRFVFSTSQAGNYHLFARIQANGGGRDSYWIRINSGAWIEWNQGILNDNSLSWNEALQSPFNLTAGTNTIDFAMRELGARLDKIHLNTTGMLPVGEGPAASNCGGGNIPPVAVASATPTSGTPPLTVSLDGTSSSDSDGTITDYDWSWSGGTATGATPSITLNTAGSYAITLTVTDDGGATDTDVVTVTVSGGSGGTDIWLEAECGIVGTNWDLRTGGTYSNGEYLVPLVSFTNNPPPDLPEHRVRFNFTVAQPGNYHLFARIQANGGGRDSYWIRINGGGWIEWFQGIINDNSLAWNEAVQSPFALNAGANTIDFAIRESGARLDKIHLNTDGTLPVGEGTTASNCGGNMLPTAVAAATPSTGPTPLVVQLDGTASSDPDGTIADPAGYAWTWSGGSTTGGIASITLTEGTYDITLTVTDDGGATATDVVTVVVSSATADSDGDGVLDFEDNCPTVPNPNQVIPTFFADLDNDGFGDASQRIEACEQPVDYVANNYDNCPTVTNTDQADEDYDGVGNACDPDFGGDEAYWLEAECAQVGANWQTVVSPIAAGGAYVVFLGTSSTSTPTVEDPGNYVRFTLENVTAASDYKIMVRVLAPTNGNDSFFGRINGGAWERWGNYFTLGSTFFWKEIEEGDFTLTAGTNTIDFHYREKDTQLDKIRVQRTPFEPVGFGGVDTSCPPDLVDICQEASPVLTNGYFAVGRKNCDGDLTVRVLNSIGTEVAEEDMLVGTNQVAFDLTEEVAGTYFVRLEETNGTVLQRMSVLVR